MLPADCRPAPSLHPERDLTTLLTDLSAALAGRYTIERQLGTGGMGAVYLANDTQLQRQVAIKVLPPELAVRPELRERFLRETRTAASFSHPNIVPVHGVEEHGQLLCFVMGYVDGETLTQRVRRAGPLAAAEATRLLQEVAWALSYAHGRGVIHRDIKPDNILIERATGRALVTDFGIARSTAASGLTAVGEVVGTPHFMSPEQAAGDVLDARSDLYSLGVVGFFAVTGRVPFDAASTQALLAMHLTKPAPPVASLRADLPKLLCDIIDRCLAKEPSARFASGEALVDALDALRSTQREVAPAIRLFEQQAGQATRIILVALIMMPAFLSGRSALDRLVFGALILAIIWGFAMQMLGRARFLYRLGFRSDDILAGIQAIGQERRTARDQLRLNLDERRRLARRNRIGLASGIGGVLGGIYVFRHLRVRVSDDVYRVSLPGVIIIVACAIMVGLSLALLATSPTRASAVQLVLARIWSGPFGRWFLRLASWRLPVTPGSGGYTGVTGEVSPPLHMFDTLPATERKRLAAQRPAIERLASGLNALTERKARLEEALLDAQQNTSGAGHATLDARRQQLLDDLSRARQEAESAEGALRAAVENVRLQLIRLKTGIGTPDDVAAEVHSAEALLPAIR